MSLIKYRYIHFLHILKKKKDAGFEIWTKVRIAYVYELYFVFLQDKLKFLNKD